MMQMPLRFVPRQGRQDLAWLSHTTSDLVEIYDFLLHAQLEADLIDETERPITVAELEAAVDSRALLEGTPYVQVGEGSVILQLSQFFEATTGVQVLAAVGLLLKKGPEIAAFPNQLRKRWYSSAEDPLRARNAYKRLERESVISFEEPPLRQGNAPERSAPPTGSYEEKEPSDEYEEKPEPPSRRRPAGQRPAGQPPRRSPEIDS